MTCGGVQVAAQRGGEGGPAAGPMGGTHGPRAVPRLDGPRADLLAAAGASRPTDTLELCDGTRSRLLRDRDGTLSPSAGDGRKVG